MATIKETALDFLSLNRVAVVGVSRNQNKTANFIYRKLRSEGFQVFAVNPNATIVEGDPCYADLKSIPVKPDWVMIVTKPVNTAQVVRECAKLAITRVWMHQGMDAKATSVSQEAVNYCRNNGIMVIPGACPMMYRTHADMGHRIMRLLLKVSGNMPKPV